MPLSPLSLWVLPPSLPGCCISPTFPAVVPLCLAVSGASDLVSDDEVPIPRLYVPFPQQLSDHAVAASLADSCAEVPFPRLPPRITLAACDSDKEVLIPLPMLFCLPSTSHPLV
jgi:hypothetical protein